MNILICDDEKDIVEALAIYLSSEGYKIYKAYNGIEALEQIIREDIHLVLLDVMMPVMDGITAMAKIRERSNVPIIMLTAKSQDTDKVLGLNVGADDYVTKPFNPIELIARVKSQLRRYMTLGSKGATVEEEDNGHISFAGIELDDSGKTVTVDGEIVNLTPTEFQILKLFMENPGKVFSPKDIYRRVWDDAPLGAEGTVAVHIRHLREKVEINPSEPRYLKVVWGQGYKLEE
ncbi:MAG: response regulator transcription factor [Lachnospiraceae bacterium]|nr:response regulator transcription factor [Lachnospiraceae bacterium]